VELIAWGSVVPAITDEPENACLKELLRACEAHPDFEVVELRRIEGSPAFLSIVVDAGDGTVAPANPAGIQRRERLALTFRPDSKMPVEVRALRKGFPATLHQNDVPPGQPPALCLYELWSTVERTWTPQMHLRQVLRWLEKTADGSLHAADQELEQLFFTTGEQIVVPAELSRAATGQAISLRLARAVQAEQRATIIVERGTGTSDALPGFDLLPISLSPIAHLPIQPPPHTMGELQERLQGMGTSLFPALLDAVRERGSQGISLASGHIPQRVLLLARIPRMVEGQVRRTDVRGFIVEIDLARLGLALGVLDQQDSAKPAFSFHYLSPDSPPLEPQGDRWREYAIYPVDVRFSPDRSMAQRMSGVLQADAEFHGVLAGVGALGSVLAELWSREGWGHWDLVDPDTLDPHNPIRHVASFRDVGQPKAVLVRKHIDALLDGSTPKAAAIVARANTMGNAQLDTAIARARLLVDATTTIDVPRDLAERDGPRIASAFLTPSGFGAVLLLEDAQRTIRVSSLEAQYYRALLTQSWGRTHLEASQLVRTGAGCRDRSLILSNELIQLHAAQLARRIRLSTAEPDAQICIWTLDDGTGAITCERVTPTATRSIERGNWQVRWDEALERQLEQTRQAAFPAETGGVLVGVVDQKLRTIHLVDGWAAPLDSKADESGFTRGKLDVLEALEECQRLTQRMVSYVGEWHSHPLGLSNAPSDLDKALLATLTMQLSADGIPAVMVIAGENGLGISLGEVHQHSAAST
jgi:Prokaryotic E2 family A/ThiF family/Prokaryotic homologs of the JAB domain